MKLTTFFKRFISFFLLLAHVQIIRKDCFFRSLGYLFGMATTVCQHIGAAFNYLSNAPGSTVLETIWLKFQQHIQNTVQHLNTLALYRWSTVDMNHLILKSALAVTGIPYLTSRPLVGITAYPKQGAAVNDRSSAVAPTLIINFLLSICPALPCGVFFYLQFKM